MPAAAFPDLDRLAAQRRLVLKGERSARVELLGEGAGAVVRKVYRNRGLRLLQTFLRRSRAAREFDNLTAAAARGLPCTPPVGWGERRVAGFVTESTLITRYVADTTTLKQAFTGLRPDTGFAARRRLLLAFGALLQRAHQKGLLWCTPMPRNVLVQGPPAAASLLLCDLPAAICYPSAVPPAAALLDLFDAVASPSRRREFSRPERLRCLLAYAAGERKAAAALWRVLARRSAAGQRLRKNLVMVLRTYILRRCRPAPPAAVRR